MSLISSDVNDNIEGLRSPKRVEEPTIITIAKSYNSM